MIKNADNKRKILAFISDTVKVLNTSIFKNERVEIDSDLFFSLVSRHNHVAIVLKHFESIEVIHAPRWFPFLDRLKEVISAIINKNYWSDDECNERKRRTLGQISVDLPDRSNRVRVIFV